MGNTRNGSKVIFSPLDQFLALMLERQEIILEGSASHVNNWKYHGTFQDYTLETLKEFASLQSTSQLLFGRGKGWFLNKLYNETQVESVSSLFIKHPKC